jgi:serine phosphatase RsbU (regulator of sigma subunit)
VRSVLAQPYKEVQNKADQKYELKEYAIAAQLYENAFVLDDSEYRTDNLYNASCSYALYGNKIKALECLEKAIDYGWGNLERASKDSDLNSLKNELKWKKLQKKIQMHYEKDSKVYYWGMYLGILFILFFYNLFLFFSIKEVSLLYYSILILMYSQFESIRTPAFSYYAENIFIWQKHFRLLGNPSNFLICLTMVFQLLFTTSFLNLKEIAPRFNKIIFFFIIYFIGCCVVIVTKSNLPIRSIIYVSCLMGLLFSFLAGVFCWYKKYRAARFFVVANITYIVGITIVILYSLKMTDIYYKLAVFRPDNIGQIAFFTLLSFAIGDKINILKMEKAGAQEKALEFLEEKVEERTQEVVRQSYLIEEKQKEIIDSITYAKRLQQAILPSDEEIKKLFPESFIYYQPKDIVAGDFYWMHTTNEFVYLAAADCTGHGVPGAMISVVCSNALNRAVNEFNLTDTAHILNKTRELVIETFEKSNDEVKDGMDISLLKIPSNISQNSGEVKVEWTGANNSLWYILNNELIEIKADKQPVGKYSDAASFTTNSLTFNSTVSFYLFSDGYADQFSTNDKKMMKKKFKEVVLSIQNLSMQEQGKHLEKFHNDWKGVAEQTDDVLVIGVKL